jgi:hypothetical protein
MPYLELIKWIDFFNKRPVGWREDQRTYLMLRSQGIKESAENLFPTLKIIKDNSVKSQKDDHAIPRGKFLDLMLKAKNGDDSGWKVNFKGNKDV